MDRRRGSDTCGDERGSVAEEGEESGIRWLLIVEEEILLNSKRTVRTHDREAKHQHRDEERSDGGEENDYDSYERETDLAIGQCAAKNDERLIIKSR